MIARFVRLMPRQIPTVLICLAAAGCGGSSAAPTTPATTAVDAVSSVINVFPAPGTPLQPGQTVTLSGTPGYTLASADLGTMVMVIQDQNDRSLEVSGVQPTVVVRRGTADTTISETITLPASGVTAVNVFFVLAPAGATTTKASVRLSYPVR